MVGLTYSAFNRIPESELVRVGFRHNDILEKFYVRTFSQKSVATICAFWASFIYYKEYQLKYGHYPLLRSSVMFSSSTIR